MAAYLGAFLLLCSIVVAQDECSLTPIFLDFHDRKVDGGISTQYGLFTGIGTPSQNLSQWPSLSNNETSVGSLDYCTGSPFADCVELSHGFYEPTLSEDYNASATYQTLDTNLGDIPATFAEYATDAFNLFEHYFDPSPPNLTVVPDFPITVISNYSSSSTPWFGPAGLFGLGPSSTILRHAHDLGLISTRSYSLYMGTYYREANGLINGSLTLGGYDSGRFEGDVYSYPIGIANPDAHNSPFSITISQMTLVGNDGEETDLLMEDFDAYLTTHQYEINLPGGVLDKFADETGAVAENDRYQLPDDFNSSLTVTLSSGLNVTFESEWLKNVSNNSPFSSIASDSTSSDDNSTTNGPAMLGSAFFTHIYMMVNYDAQPQATFHLALARPHGPYVMTRTICADTIPTAAAVTNISGFAASGLVGAVVGGVVGGIGLTFLGWWAFRKYAQRRMWANRRRMAMKGKGVEGGNVPIGASGAAGIFSKGKGSPSTFASSSAEDVNNDENIDERHRTNSAEMTNYAFDFNDGVPRGWRNPAFHDGDPNSANSPGSFTEGYAIVAKEMTPSLVQVQRQTHDPQAYSASIHNNSDEYARAPSPPLTAQPLMSYSNNNTHNSNNFNGDLYSQANQQFPQQYQSSGHDFMSPVSPPSTTTATMDGGFGRSPNNPPRANLPAIQTEFAPPPRREMRSGENSSRPRKESLLRRVLPG